MPRLIDADALMKRFEETQTTCKSVVEVLFFDGVMAMLENTPTIDAEPVTRCNMCKYYEADVGFCHYHDHGMHWDDFCSRCAKMDLEVQDETQGYL